LSAPCDQILKKHKGLVRDGGQVGFYGLCEHGNNLCVYMVGFCEDARRGARREL
jgi:hypothetical protein